MKVAVLGATGMLGSMLVGYLSKYFEVVATARNKEYKPLKGVELRYLDAFKCEDSEIENAIKGCAWVINAIGAIPQKKRVADYVINSLLPTQLIQEVHCPIIQIATDCVYKGEKGSYTEESSFNPADDYGTSKLLGEVVSANMHHLRCSIIGREYDGDYSYSLLGWFLSQRQGAVIKGYVNHRWNGVTTLHFAKVCQGIIKNSISLSHMQHLVPADSVSKYQLLRLFAKEFQREDITIKPMLDFSTDRTLATVYPKLNRELWQVAGYDEPPTIEQMVKEFAE